jgi:hypothetical protein
VFQDRGNFTIILDVCCRYKSIIQKKKTNVAKVVKNDILNISRNNNPDVNKDEGQSLSAHCKITGRPECICQPGAHSQEKVPLFNNNFSVENWQGIIAAIVFFFCYNFMNLLISHMN